MPEELTKGEFVAEIQKRGKIDTKKLPTFGKNEWYRSEYTENIYCYNNYILIIIHDLNIANPPVVASAITFQDFKAYVELEGIDKSWALSVIDKLPFEGIRKTVTFKSIPENAGVTCKSI